MVLRRALLVLAPGGDLPPPPSRAPRHRRVHDDGRSRLSPRAAGGPRRARRRRPPKIRSRRQVLDGVRDFYEARRLRALVARPIDKPTPQMTALRRMMDRADDYGLDPAAYPTPNFAPTLSRRCARRSPRADVEFSRAVARFVTHLASGRIRPADISSIITLEPERPDVGDGADAPVAVDRGRGRPRPLRAAAPAIPRAQGSARRSSARCPSEAERIVVPEGELLKPGKADERVPLLRARLGTVARRRGASRTSTTPRWSTR